MFQQAWGTIDPNNFNPGIQNHNIVMDIVNDVCDHIIKFSKDRLLEKQPRDDYRGRLELIVIFFARKLSNDISFKIPVAIHQARWMANSI